MPIVSMPGTPVQNAGKWLDWGRWRRENNKNAIMHTKDGEPVWIDRDRRVYRLSEIPDKHLKNIERWLLGRGAEDIPARKRAYDAGWYGIVRDELERRGLEVLDDHKDAFDEKVTLRTGDQTAAMQQRYKEIILAERLLDSQAREMGFGYIIDAELNDKGLDGKPRELAYDDEPGWNGEEIVDESRPW